MHGWVLSLVNGEICSPYNIESQSLSDIDMQPVLTRGYEIFKMQ